QQMANFNSLSRQQMGLAPSQYHTAAREYFSQPQQKDWQQLALQEISDFVVFASPTQLTKVITEQLPHLPSQVLVSLFSSLENRELNKADTVAIIDWAKQHHNDSRQVALALRALSLSSADNKITTYITELLSEQQQTPLDVLIVIAGRHWQRLGQDSLLLSFF